MRHIADKHQAAGQEKTRAFYEIARRERPVHPASMALLRRPRAEGEEVRLREFARIARGREV